MKKLLAFALGLSTLPVGAITEQELNRKFYNVENIDKLEKIQKEIEGYKTTKGALVFQRAYNRVTNKIEKAKAKLAKTDQQKAPAKPIPPTPTAPSGAFKPTGPPPIPEGALDEYPPIQGPPAAPPMAPPPAAAPPRQAGVKPAGPPAARPAAITGRSELMKAIREGTRLRKQGAPMEKPKPADSRDALLEAIRAGRQLKPTGVEAKPERELTPLEKALAVRRGSIQPEDDNDVEDDNGDWDE